MFTIEVLEIFVFNRKAFLKSTDGLKIKPNVIMVYGKYSGNVRLGDILVEENSEHTFEVIEFPMVRHSPYREDCLDILLKPHKVDVQSQDLKVLAEGIRGHKLSLYESGEER